MSADLAAPPVLSTPDDYIIEIPATTISSTLSPKELIDTYEIVRTAREITSQKWKRIALQFPDHMLVDAPCVVEQLYKELSTQTNTTTSKEGSGTEQPKFERRIYVLADTSYSACCVDEIAAEHVDADGVVHYGRSCLSPTSRLPIIYVYTRHELDHNAVIEAFEKDFSEKSAKVVFMADVTFQDHVAPLVEGLVGRGYTNILGTDVMRDPNGVIPNRRIQGPELLESELKSYDIFHLSNPPSALLLALHSRFASLYVYPTSFDHPSSQPPAIQNPTSQTAGLLRRRFAKVLSLASAGVIGILVNTLSVSNYLSSMDLLKEKIARAGKKSYTIVVGKLNPAKLANFAEIDGWVVVGCWESGLVEDDAEYWRPVVTPFELEVALIREEERTWGGEWWGGMEKLKVEDSPLLDSAEDQQRAGNGGYVAEQRPDEEAADKDYHGEDEVEIDGEESLPPQYDLRTGKLVSRSRPMHGFISRTHPSNPQNPSSASPADSPIRTGAIIKRTIAGEIASINGVASPGAEFLRSQRTWQGLGSDFATADVGADGEARADETSAVMEEGRSGVARGYHVGEDVGKH